MVYIYFKNKIKLFLNFFLFTPKFFNIFSHFKNKNSLEIKPYFGVNIFKTGGPYLRTKKISKIFGNNIFFPNIIYAQSYWSSKELIDACKYSKKNNIPLVFNQNGWFYKGWFKDDWARRNSLLVEVQKLSDYVIYQSKFCKLASKKLNKNFYKTNSKILYNCLQEYKASKKKLLKKNYFLISGVFDENSRHIIEPAIKALNYFAKNYAYKENKMKLILGGYFTDQAKKTEWYFNIKEKITKLIDLDILEFRGKYNNKNLSSFLRDISFCLHLKYKDPCPNAVVERIQNGIIHIFSNSGGTPELIGKAGLPIYVKDTWSKQISVDHKILIKKILKAIKNKKKLYKNVMIQSKKFSYKNYIKFHEKIFLDLIHKYEKE